jgi:RND family efflux transporter MFP subunit
MTGTRKRRALWLISGSAVVLALAVGGAWSWLRPLEATEEIGTMEIASPAARPPDAVARIGVARVERRDLSVRREATGYLEPARRVQVAAEAAGRVVERRVREGERVAAGQILVRLDPRDRILEVREAEAEWLKIRAQYAVEYEREPGPEAAAAPPAVAPEAREAEHLFAQGLISRQELVEARRRQETAGLLSGSRQGEIRAVTSGLVQAEQRLERARLALERTEITAPFAGRVADLAVEPGQQIAPGETLLTLLEDARLEVDVDVLEADVVRLRPGAPARVRVPALDDLVLEGTVHTINPLVDSATGTGRVTVRLPNPRGRLMPGLFAYVEMETGRLADRLQVPVAAVLERQDRQLVFRIEDGRALWTYVTLGARSGDLVEITDGLAEGDRVAVKDHFALAHEAPVEVVP